MVLDLLPPHLGLVLHIISHLGHYVLEPLDIPLVRLDDLGQIPEPIPNLIAKICNTLYQRIDLPILPRNYGSTYFFDGLA